MGIIQKCRHGNGKRSSEEPHQELMSTPTGAKYKEYHNDKQSWDGGRRGGIVDGGGGDGGRREGGHCGATIEQL